MCMKTRHAFVATPKRSPQPVLLRRLQECKCSALRSRFACALHPLSSHSLLIPSTGRSSLLPSPPSTVTPPSATVSLGYRNALPSVPSWSLSSRMASALVAGALTVSALLSLDPCYKEANTVRRKITEESVLRLIWREGCYRYIDSQICFGHLSTDPNLQLITDKNAKMSFETVIMLKWVLLTLFFLQPLGNGHAILTQLNRKSLLYERLSVTVYQCLAQWKCRFGSKLEYKLRLVWEVIL